MNIELLELINEYMEKGDFIGEVSEDYIARAEKILEVNFPPEYKEFVKKFGSGGICGVDVLGIEGADYASVVESTKRYRKLGLPKKYIVIENVDEFVYCLSTLDEYNVVRWDDISSKKELDRYTTFYEYLQDSFQEAIDNWD
ncbi:SMI1/KNR4 family protein [Peribacillus frigoritolerans]|uniref:SMI1/KNR4 family protein n=1 Tax=Peribacillus frigoritolerans TaxID=450367 RepID=UPI000BBA1B9D|nr:SMI1/KNR4 family protein [Peribacillus frigoritolerans]MDM5308114.1 SMI1/KNR4 family protein [Peribacillus frigoritolerans]PCD06307.1 spore coat protein [Peribacillus simplex]